MDFKKDHVAIILLLALVVVGLYHFGILNLVMPGEKTLSERSAKRRALYIADVATTAANNVANGGQTSGPIPLPLANTWGGEEKRAA